MKSVRPAISAVGCRKLQPERKCLLKPVPDQQSSGRPAPGEKADGRHPVSISDGTNFLPLFDLVRIKIGDVHLAKLLWGYSFCLGVVGISCVKRFLYNKYELPGLVTA